MFPKKCFLLFLFLCFGSFQLLFASKILAVLPIGGKSHFKIYMSLLNELSVRGHQITFLSPLVEENSHGVKFIDISEKSFILVNNLSICDFQRYPTMNKKGSLSVDLQYIHHRLFENYDVVKNLSGFHNTKTVIDFMDKSDETFDLVIIELMYSDCDYIFGHKFNAPIITISTSPLVPWGYSRLGNPNNPSYIRPFFSVRGSLKNFWGRMTNALEVIVYDLAFNLLFLPHMQEVLDERYKNAPLLDDLIKNTSLVLSNTHFSLHRAKPMVPNIIEICGIHVKPQSNKLPEELQSFIDGAEHGVIYFCMGSMLKASTIPDEKRDALVKVFARLPQRVLWKWENDTMPGKSENVKIVKWMPQRDILAHPNVKLFISHGGLLGTTEAVHCGVPIIGIPFYGDQAGNIEAVASHGAGLRLDYNDIDERNLYEKITQILNDPKFAENAKALSERFRDRPQSPLETAVYWTEYVIRHKGAPHLRSAAVDLAWYQYLLLDVIAFLLLVALVTILSFYYTLKFIVRKLFKKQEPTNKNSKKVKRS